MPNNCYLYWGGKSNIWFFESKELFGNITYNRAILLLIRRKKLHIRY